ncbi:OB-fold domain-containing protein [Sphaerisporangium sp. NPDC051011]|uniref:OB-fold domain-containing protein n=1 Tax=Sphaerisporangium sp. NPDC051011 TaxID=3155792 RepID=UPI00340DDF09
MPYWRLSRETISSALGSPRRGGVRTVAGYDEDTTTMAVEAARRAGPGAGTSHLYDGVLLATTMPVYADKTNATTVHAALGMRPDAHAGDANGAVRSGVAALLGGIQRPGTTLVALSDLRLGPSGSVDEAEGGDGAAAFVVGDGSAIPLVAELIGYGSASREFLDRWRAPGEKWSSSWEERFGEDVYAALGRQSIDSALKAAGIAAADIDRFAIVGLSGRAAKRVAKDAGVTPDSATADLMSQIGNCGTAQPGLALSAMLDTAGPGEILAVTLLADGSDTLLFRTTEALGPRVGRDSLATQISGPSGDVSYADFLTWRGLLQRQQPRRPDPDRAVAPASNRQLEWKFGFSCSECQACGVRHMPPQRVCMSCGTVDQMRSVRLADTPGRIATYTVDYLAYSPAPPVIGAVLDFDGGGRFQCELTDLDADSLAVGQRVEMTFRHISDANGIRNYFWKARPTREEQQA